jgi:hypothetical protein
MHSLSGLREVDFFEMQSVALNGITLDPNFVTDLRTFGCDIRQMFQGESMDSARLLATDKLHALRSELAQQSEDLYNSKTANKIDTLSPLIKLNKLKISIIEQELALRGYELSASWPDNQFSFYKTLSDELHEDVCKAQLIQDQEEYCVEKGIELQIPGGRGLYTVTSYDWRQWEEDQQKEQKIHLVAALFTSQPQMMTHHVQQRYLLIDQPNFNEFQLQLKNSCSYQEARLQLRLLYVDPYIEKIKSCTLF